MPETGERTRVELEHRHLDRHGDGWEGMREGVAGDQGWPLYLERPPIKSRRHRIGEAESAWREEDGYGNGERPLHR